MSLGTDSTLETGKAYSEIREMLNSAEQLMHVSRADEALEMLQTVLKTNADHPQALNTLGLCHYRMKNYSAAIATFTDLIHTDPEQLAFRLNMSLVLIKLERLDEAQESLDHVLSIEPNHERAHAVLGLVYEQKGDFDKAMSHYDRGGENQRLSHLQRLSLTPSLQTPPTDAVEDLPMTDTSASMEASSAAEIQAQEETDLQSDLKAPSEIQTATSEEEAEPLSLPPSKEAQASGSPEIQTRDENNFDTLPPPADMQQSAPETDELSMSIHELSQQLTCPTQITVPQKPADDLLLFPVNEHAYVRLATTSALIGALRTQKVMRRLNGEDTRIRLGGQAPLTRLIGKGAALIFTGTSQSKLLKLNEDDLCLMEDTVLAFSSKVTWENSLLSGPNFDLQILRLQGSGHVAIATSRALLAISVQQKRPVQAHSSQVVGWTGNIKPILSPFSIEPEEDNAAMLFEGDGTVWVLAEHSNP